MRKISILAAAAALAASLLAIPAQAAPQDSHPVRSAGCGTASAIEPGTSQSISLESGGLQRTAVLSIPEGYTGAEAEPLILAFHGRGSTGELTREFSGLDQLPAITVFPDGIAADGKQSWQGAPYAAQGLDDVQFTNDLLDRVEQDYCVNTRRIFATGKSNGGGFTALLACKAADRIAAFAPVAGAYYPGTDEDCDGAAAPIIEFHGTGDATMKYNGGESHGAVYPSVPSWLDMWAQRNGCESSSTKQFSSDTTRTSWRQCDLGNDLVHLAIADGGHTWPGQLAYSGGGYATSAFNASDVMFKFFTSHPLNR